jgi:hypothetical protein
MYKEWNCGCGPHWKHDEPGEEKTAGLEGCCGYGGDMRFHRHFISREDIVAGLEDYLKQLQAETKAVEERVAEMKKPKQA